VHLDQTFLDLKWTAEGYVSSMSLQGMVVGMFVTYFTPTWIFVKVIELAIFAVMFFVIPIVARLPVYDPMA
jgi:hypothetical protein